MRKKIDRVIFIIGRIGLSITLILAVLSAITAIITVSFDLNSRISLGKDSWISLTDFDRGIPFHATLGLEIPDSSIVSTRPGGTSLHNYYSYNPITKPVSWENVTYSDRIMADFKVLNDRGEARDIKISGAKLKDAVLYLQPREFWDRLLLSLPTILSLLLIAFCSWQLLQLVRAIHSGNSFSQSSPKRIARIGWAVLFTVLLLFIHDILQNRVTNIVLDFSSTIPNYRMPFQATAHKEGSFRLDWLIGGAIILLVAKAFKYGNQLQKYEDSTI